MEKIVNLMNTAITWAQLGVSAYAGYVVIFHLKAMMNKNTQKVEEGREALERTLMATAGIWIIGFILQKIIEAAQGV